MPLPCVCRTVHMEGLSNIYIRGGEMLDLMPKMALVLSSAGVRGSAAAMFSEEKVDALVGLALEPIAMVWAEYETMEATTPITVGTVAIRHGTPILLASDSDERMLRIMYVGPHSIATRIASELRVGKMETEMLRLSTTVHRV